jgi:adenylate cyclase class 2
MKTEIEAKFLNVNFDEIRQKLTELGAVCRQPMQLMRRVTFDTPEMAEKHGFLRVRDEGHQITMTYKQFDEMSLTGAKEIEVTVSNYEDTIALVRAAGLNTKSLQEARRELWLLDNVEIMLDEWPWANPFMEIEASTEEGVKETASKLGLKWEDAVFGDLNQAFRVQYPHMAAGDAVYNLPEIKFDAPLPEMLKTQSA